MHILYLVHGYPPDQSAGTEEHTRQVVEGMRERGHTTHVIAATRAPGQPQYARIKSEGLTRIVNNIPARPLSANEMDPAIENAVYSIVQDEKPDLIHIQHTQFLSVGLRFSVPVVLTLHDAWLWCPAGGTLLHQPSQTPCPGPSPRRCAPCATHWRPVPSATAQRLMHTAGRLAPLIKPEKLHRLWNHVPASIRAPIAREGHKKTETERDASTRNKHTIDLARSADLIISPSHYLAQQATAAGTGPVSVIPHGVAPGHPRIGGGPFLFLGTIAHHKGPDLVVAAWRRAFPAGDPPLLIHGPVQDASAAANHPIGKRLTRKSVMEHLSRARALVLGSRWPENAPLVISEARAAQCPVIAPDIGGIPELIAHGEDGFLYPPGDVQALSVAMRTMVEQPPGPIRTPPSNTQQLNVLARHYAQLVRP